MRKKFAVAISAIMMVVILATIISFTFAWFSASNSNVSANDGRFTADETDTAFIPVDIVINPTVYSGETGLDTNLGDEDYPFKAVTTFSIALKPLKEGYAVTGKISAANIKLENYSLVDGVEQGIIKSDDNPEILKNFSWDLYLVTPPEGEEALNNYFPSWYLGKTGNDWYASADSTSKIENTTFTHYFPSECFGKNDNIVRDIDGNPIELNNVGESKVYVFVVELTFLDRDSYCLFKKNTSAPHPNHEIGIDELKSFAYSDYQYMNSLFEIYFDVGFIKLLP